MCRGAEEDLRRILVYSCELCIRTCSITYINNIIMYIVCIITHKSRGKHILRIIIVCTIHMMLS